MSILTMEIVDNAVMTAIPGAMNAGLVNVTFWVGMMIAGGRVRAAFPVNRILLQRGKGHARTHDYHGMPTQRRFPAFATSTLVAVLLAFMLGGLVVAIADEAAASETPAPPASTHGSRWEGVDTDTHPSAGGAIPRGYLRAVNR